MTGRWLLLATLALTAVGCGDQTEPLRATRTVLMIQHEVADVMVRVSDEESARAQKLTLKSLQERWGKLAEAMQKAYTQMTPEEARQFQRAYESYLGDALTVMPRLASQVARLREIRFQLLLREYKKRCDQGSMPLLTDEETYIDLAQRALIMRERSDDFLHRVIEQALKAQAGEVKVNNDIAFLVYQGAAAWDSAETEAELQGQYPIFLDMPLYRQYLADRAKTKEQLRKEARTPMPLPRALRVPRYTSSSLIQKAMGKRREAWDKNRQGPEPKLETVTEEEIRKLGSKKLVFYESGLGSNEALRDKLTGSSLQIDYQSLCPDLTQLIDAPYRMMQARMWNNPYVPQPKQESMMP